MTDGYICDGISGDLCQYKCESNFGQPLFLDGCHSLRLNTPNLKKKKKSVSLKGKKMQREKRYHYQEEKRKSKWPIVFWIQIQKQLQKINYRIFPRISRALDRTR